MLALGTMAALCLPAAALPWLAAAAVGAWQLALLAFVTARPILCSTAALASIALSAGASAAHADRERRHGALLAFAAPARAGASRADPLFLEGVLRDDASLRPDGGAVMHLRVDRIRGRAGSAIDVEGGALLSVAGAVDPAAVRTWTRGRALRAPVTLRRHAHYRNDGVADAGLSAMRRGIAVAGSIKSASLVEIIGPAPWLDEAFARARAGVRDAIARHTAADPAAGGVVTAILIGDRAGLDDDLERRMQRAGTYHVIAISGGNIALFTMLAWGACRVLFRARRAALCGAIVMVVMYGLLVGAGASVGRAVAAAVVALLTTLADHRSPPLNVIAAVGAGFLVWDPLALVDLGFLLSFGATAGILLAVPRWTSMAKARIGARATRPRMFRAVGMLCAMIAATAAAEIALLPIQAWAFQRLTVAGLVLNLIAIPAMAVTQVAGMAIVAAAAVDAAAAAAWASAAARVAARALLDSASLVDLLPALTWRVATPPGWLLAAYVAAVALLAWSRWPRLHGAAAAVAIAAGAAIAMSAPGPAPRPGHLRLSMFDVGQAEAMVVRLPSGRSVLVDAGGSPGRFDAGDRVVVPALLARGITRLDWFLLTHADADHAGGAVSVINDLRPARLLEGIVPARHADREGVTRAAAASGASIEALRAGSTLLLDGVLFDVLHPPEPEWERQDVRNDDSVVVDVRFGSVSILLTGDAGEPVEQAIAGRARPARLRILKAGHHGSRTSTSQALLDAVRPAAALVSAGRGNFYGHPSPAVIARLRRAGVEVFRTDEDGQIDLVTDGRTVEISTWRGRRWALAAR